MLQHYSYTPYTPPRGQYKDYYMKSQFGRGGILPAYKGAPVQRGHGIGSFLSGLFRSAVPMLSTVGRTVAKKAGKALLSTGAEILGDVLSGKNVKSSIVNRSKAAGKNLLKRAANATGAYLNDSLSPPPTKRRATTVGKGRQRKRANQQGQGRRKSNKKKNKRQSKKSTLF